MPFESTDPRASLTALPDPEASSATAFARAQYIAFTDELPELAASGIRTWYVRIENCVVAYSIGLAGAKLERLGEESERIVAIPDPGTTIGIATEDGLVEMQGPAIATVPPGLTNLHFVSDGVVIQIFTRAAKDVLARAINRERYDSPPPNVRVHDPEPTQEDRVRTYSLRDYPPEAGRFGTIFRSTNLMINFINDRKGPRDPTKLSPHSHADFEQCSIQLGGRIVHHVRTPWTPDKNTWREDEHVELEGAGIVIFPPPMIHTSQAVGDGTNRLIDVFSPARADFLEKGWVLNSALYADFEVPQ
jgi:hypothetical protein